ncbi:uncharacterized protein LOC119371296 isoform X2 [Jatropha curcas]|uniref:uncharacterized protein LOC119371296 isoform X2 n=1 Tax=Jatropha curcas TaxID=180498 RepID=UPI0018956B43|nr:uncharacterized protein LOC119371296 isoform X2 [Jatropha curcas]
MARNRLTFFLFPLFFFFREAGATPPFFQFLAIAQRERGGDRLPWSRWSIFRPPSALAEPPMARNETVSIDSSRSSLSGDAKRLRPREASRCARLAPSQISVIHCDSHGGIVRCT